MGIALVMGGAVVFLGQTGRLDAIGDLLLSGLVLGVGLFLLFGPFVWRALGELVEERRQRIRSEERADLAAHLHDSVLQTLALIQRTDDPNRVAVLARRQERELRAWLYGATPTDAGTLEAAVTLVAEDVETEHAVPVEVVVVGDEPLGEAGRALVRAVQEAVRNAARHAVGPISVYVESSAGGISAFVRDRGPGFDLAAVPDDRRGIRDSIVGRLERRGGTAAIEPTPDGTEISLWVPSTDQVARGEASTPGAEVDG
jgi:signal transduction histidine kinase